MTSEKHYCFVKCREMAMNTPRRDKTFEEALKYFHENVFLCDGGIIRYYHRGELNKMKCESFFFSKTMGFPSDFVERIKETITEHDEDEIVKKYELSKKEIVDDKAIDDAIKKMEEGFDLGEFIPTKKEKKEERPLREKKIIKVKALKIVKN